MSCAEKVELEPEIEKIITYEFGQSGEDIAVVTDLVWASYGDKEKKAHLEKQFVEILKRPEATFACKDYICRQLWIIGSDISIPVLGKMLLMDKKTSDIARYALQENPSPKANKILLKAAKKAEGLQLIGIINTLGERRDPSSVKTLDSFLDSPDKEVTQAAEAALVKIGE
ncbi:HEAT repeat domain-containing protein [Candidatus Latescibacterota bacterium]